MSIPYSTQMATEEAAQALSGGIAMISLPHCRIEYVNEDGSPVGFLRRLFGAGKRRLLPSKETYSLKHGDMAYLEEMKDDFGKVYTRAYLEARARLYIEFSFLRIPMPMPEVQRLINEATRIVNVRS